MNLITRAKDANKDQTYFIWQIKQERLPHILFPVGEFDVKADVRAFAESKGLITSNKPDSQGLCFVGQTSLRDMLLQTLGRKDGFIYTYLTQEQIDKIGLKVTKKARGEFNSLGQLKVQLGKHEGAFLYTVGQRQNLGISNGPWFVAEVDIVGNEVIVCHQDFQESIMSQYLLVKDLNWHLDITKESTYTKSKPTQYINKLDITLFFESSDIQHLSAVELQVKAQIRYRSEAKNCRVFLVKDLEYENKDVVIVKFDKPIKAAAKGQSIVFYDYDTDQYLLGGGVIDKVLQ
jgi:tRNA-uridine 2-sulfurtransferase